jgi:hypothetical protein
MKFEWENEWMKFEFEKKKWNVNEKMNEWMNEVSP